MGNAGSTGPSASGPGSGSGPAPGSATRHQRQLMNDTIPSSPNRDGSEFVFDNHKRSDGRVFRSLHGSQEDDEGTYGTPSQSHEIAFEAPPRPRANTVSEGTKISEKVLPTVFRWERGGKQVLISGTFSDWKTLPMVKSHGDFVTIVDLPEGEYEYKFYVDGEWRHDPALKIIDNGMGSKNNLVSVKKSDFEVFQALDKDSENKSNDSERQYSQEIPPNKPWEKSSGPPILPPHLLQDILNKDTPLSCEPTLLPEPNHVMLNHLFALSIKEGVMVLSATHRYRKKYVTTLLYKPI